jgi:hypothetical protein
VCKTADAPSALLLAQLVEWVADMTRGPCTFRQQDITRAIRAAFAAGATKARVEIGGIVITAQKIEEEQGKMASPGGNEWDAPLAGEDTQ